MRAILALINRGGSPLATFRPALTSGLVTLLPAIPAGPQTLPDCRALAVAAAGCAELFRVSGRIWPGSRNSSAEAAILACRWTSADADVPGPVASRNYRDPDAPAPPPRLRGH